MDCLKPLAKPEVPSSQLPISPPSLSISCRDVAIIQCQALTMKAKKTNKYPLPLPKSKNENRDVVRAGFFLFCFVDRK